MHAQAHRHARTHAHITSHKYTLTDTHLHMPTCTQVNKKRFIGNTYVKVVYTDSQHPFTLSSLSVSLHTSRLRLQLPGSSTSVKSLVVPLRGTIRGVKIPRPNSDLPP